MHTHIWHARVITTVVGCTALVLAVTGTTAQAQPRDPGRQTLAADDGWGSEGSGTTGGAAADAEHVHTVTSWAEFKAALAADGTAPKIIKVKGVIDPVAEGCASFAAPGYDFAAYLGFTAEILHLRNATQLAADFGPDRWRVCSALVADALEAGGVPLDFVPEDGPSVFGSNSRAVMPPNLVAPGMLLGLAQRLDWC